MKQILLLLTITVLTGCLSQPDPVPSKQTELQLDQRGSDSTVHSPKDYIPVFVQWSHASSFSKNQEAVFRFTVRALQPVDGVVLTPVLDPVLRSDTPPASYGPMSAGQEITYEIRTTPEQEGEFSIGLHISAELAGNRMGTVRMITFQTSEYTSLKKETDTRLQKQSNGETIHMVPAATH